MSILLQLLDELRADLLPRADKWVDAHRSNQTTATQLFSLIKVKGGTMRGFEIGAAFGFADRDVKKLLARMVRRGRLIKMGGANEMRAQYTVPGKK